MKKITLLVASLLLSFGMNAQIFEEDFEEGLGDWEVISNSGDAVWKSADSGFPNMSGSPWGPGPLEFGSLIALVDDDADGPSGEDNTSLVSPVIDLSGASDATLTFDFFNVAFEFEPTLMVEVYNGSSWEMLDLFIGDVADTENPNVLLSSDEYDLSGYTNEDFRIRFIYDDGGGWQFGAGVDNVVIDGTLSVQDSNINGFSKMYSTQSKNLTIAANENFTSISMFNVLGQQVLSRNLSSNNEVINLSNMKDGVYIANVTAGGNTTTFKIVKR